MLFFKDHNYFQIKSNIIQCEKEFSYVFDNTKINQLDDLIIQYISYLTYLLNLEKYKYLNHNSVYKKIENIINTYNLIKSQDFYDKKYKKYFKSTIYSIENIFLKLLRKTKIQ